MYIYNGDIREGAGEVSHLPIMVFMAMMICLMMMMMIYIYGI